LEQVEGILGSGQAPLPTLGITGGTLFGCCRYDHLGLIVHFVGDRDGTLRVDHITFEALFDETTPPPAHR
jgi:hypothetical protein